MHDNPEAEMSNTNPKLYITSLTAIVFIIDTYSCTHIFFKEKIFNMDELDDE